MNSQITTSILVAVTIMGFQQQVKAQNKKLTKSANEKLSKPNKWGIPASGLFCEEKGARRRVANHEDQIMATSIYNVPVQGESGFWKKVSLNGSGLTTNGLKVTFSNKKPHTNIATNGEICDGRSGSVEGSGGLCLSPFFSVAADLRFYAIGDIICVNEMHNKSFVLPGRGLVKHSGCFIVGDKGAAIKGENRFDFFTGTAKNNKTNPFKSLMDKGACRNTFHVVRVGSPQWKNKMNDIESSMNYGMSTGQLISRYSVAANKAIAKRFGSRSLAMNNQ